VDHAACRQPLAKSPRCLLCVTRLAADAVVSCFKVQAFLLALFCWILPGYVLRRLEKQVCCCCCCTPAALGLFNCCGWQAVLPHT
jgi:hypothetical protein